MVDYTPHQKGIIRRYYEHRDTIALQKLAEIVSDLYLAESPAAKKKLWARVEKSLANLDCPSERRAWILENHDLADLAKLLGELYG